MSSQPRLRPVQGLFLIYLLFAGLLTATSAIAMAHDPDERAWTLGDWLIGYQGGFVRRGLAGEVLRLVSIATHVSPVPILLALQLLLYAVLFASVWMLLRQSQWPWWVKALAFSPATLGFQVLDPHGGFRKELLFVAGLGVLLCVLAKGRAKDGLVSVAMALLVALSTLSHEAIFCYLPYLVAGAAIALREPGRVMRVLAAPAAVAILSATFVALHPGDPRIATAICDSLSAQGPAELKGLCGGAIQHLGDTPAEAREAARAQERVHPFGSFYGPLLLLALLPIGLSFVQLWQCRDARRSLRILGGAIVLSAAATVPLFLYALDWGRWIYIHIVCIALLLFLIDLQRQHSVIAVPERRNLALRLAAGLAILLYAVAWSLPHIPVDGRRSGYAGRFLFKQQPVATPAGSLPAD